MPKKKKLVRDDEALTSIAEAYYRGIVMPQNYDKAFTIYQKAANMGNPIALSWLGKCYEYGKGTTVNMTSALDCYQKAAEQDEVIGTYKLGDFYYKGVQDVVEQNYEKALQYYFDALIIASQTQDVWNTADIYLRIADALLAGKGVARNITTAIQMYQAAIRLYISRINQGDHECMDDIEHAENQLEYAKHLKQLN